MWIDWKIDMELLIWPFCTIDIMIGNAYITRYVIFYVLSYVRSFSSGGHICHFHIWLGVEHMIDQRSTSYHADGKIFNPSEWNYHFQNRQNLRIHNSWPLVCIMIIFTKLSEFSSFENPAIPTNCLKKRRISNYWNIVIIHP